VDECKPLYVGAGLATSWSNGVVLAINVGWLCFDKSHIAAGRSSTWGGWSLKAATSEWGPFLRLALPGILMMAEWWASEANILIAGLLPNPTYNVAGVSIFQAGGLFVLNIHTSRVDERCS
jgi:MATE family multidrug resistance protein